MDPSLVRSRPRAVTEESFLCFHLYFWQNLSWLVRLARRLDKALLNEVCTTQ